MNTVLKGSELVSYTPKKKGRRWITSVTSTENNGGLHNVAEFKKAVAMLTYCAHNLPNPRLHHVCFTGGNRAIYQLVIKRLCRVLRLEGVATRYSAALEEDKVKDVHCHLFIVLSSAEQQTTRFITAADESQKKVLGDSSLRKVVHHTLTECPTLKYRVMVPENPNVNESDDGSKPKKVGFLQFNKTNRAFFDNAVEWLSYAYKARSKPASGGVYLSDRQPKTCVKPRRKARQSCAKVAKDSEFVTVDGVQP